MNCIFKRLVITVLSATTVLSFSSAVLAETIETKVVEKARADELIKSSNLSYCVIFPNKCEYIFNEPFVENDPQEMKKLTVDPTDPEVQLNAWNNAPNNPMNRSYYDTLSTAEKAQRVEQSHKLFVELHDDYLLSLGIGIGTAEEKEFFCSAVALSKGDVNYDSKLNARDVSAIQKYILNPENASDLQWYLADYNSDGKINARDVSALMNAIN